MDDQFSIETEDSPAGVAETLRSLAAQFETGERLRIAEGERAAAAALSDTLSVELDLERGPGGDVEFEVEVEWTDPSVERAETGDRGKTVDDLSSEAADGTDGTDGTDGSGESMATFQLFEDRAGEWRWRLRHRNGNVIADSGEGYTTKENARKGLRSVARNAPGAAVVEIESPD